MKILYISNKKLINKDEVLKWFNFYCENSDDLYLYQNLKSAKDFLTKEILDEKRHIDFIITDWKFGSENAKSLLSWIRQSEEIYSSGNFLFRSLPVILIEDKINQSATINDGFDSVIQDFPNDSLKLKYSIKDAIKTWRYSLAADLSLIGLDPKTQIVYSEHRMSFISYYRLKIFTREFVNNKSKRLNYIWTNEKSDILYDSSSEFLDKMNRTIKNPPRYLEKEFHDFFIQNPIFIKGEDFLSTPDQMIYEKHFYKNGTKSYDEPDFVNKPYEYALRYPEIFEIKRQSQRFFTKKADRFLSRTKKSFEQVKRYKEYFESDDPQHKAYVKKYLGEIYSSYDILYLWAHLMKN